MPEGLRRYWAKKRGRKVRRTGFRKVVVKHMARRRSYFRRARGRLSKNVSIMGIAGAAGFAIKVLAMPGPHYSSGDCAIAHLLKGEWSAAGQQAMDNLTDWKTYVIAIAPPIAGKISRIAVGRVKISRGVTLN